MLVHTQIIAFLALGGLALGACGKDESGPPPATAQVNQDEPIAPAEPEQPSEPEPRAQSAAERRGPVDRAAAIQSMFSLMESGELAQAFKYLDEDVVWSEVGLPAGELESVAAIIDFHHKSRTGFSDFRMKARRIIDAADYQVVEYVWSARHTGAFADGTPATDRVATLPGAMLLRYQSEGLIDRVWVFQDWPNALQQLGLAPGLPERFSAAALPAKSQLVSGAYNPLYRVYYAELLAQLRPGDYRDAIAEHTGPDFTWTDLASGQVMRGHQEASEEVGRRLTSFVPVSSEIGTAIGAGDTLAAYVTHQLVYKGGFMGVPGEDQQITTHTLDIVRFDPESRLIQSLTSYGNSYEVLAALQLTAGSASRPEARAQSLGITACDDYVERMRMCLESLDSPMLDITRAALDVQMVLWEAERSAGMTQDQLRQSCLEALAAARSSLAASCPRVSWD